MSDALTKHERTIVSLACRIFAEQLKGTNRDLLVGAFFPPDHRPAARKVLETVCEGLEDEANTILTGEASLEADILRALNTQDPT